MTLALRTLLLSVCLFVSGSAALIYEVLWSRQFALVMGSTVYALSTVISVFLGGLALGAWLGGRWTRRHGASLRLYGALEIAIGLTAVAVPLFIRFLDPLFGIAYRSVGDSLVTYSLVQLVLCAPVILVPTMLMGATLPIATAWLLRGSGEVTRGVSVLYAMNTLGGVVGAGAAGFFLLPSIGMASTAWVAVGLNFTAGLIALVVSRVWETAAAGVPADRGLATGAGVAPPAAATGPWSTAPAALALLYGVSGFAALCLEVGWARLVGLSIGSTTYGFTIILVAFIGGIGLGSLLLPRLGFLRRDPLRGVFLLHAVIALAGIISGGYLGQLPVVILELMTDPARGSGGWLLREVGVVFATIALPTLAMGGIFPLLATLLHRAGHEAGYATGLAYAANTVGNILGSLVAGFVMVPLIGMRATIIAAAALSGLAGIGYLLPRLRQRAPAALAQGAALLAAMVTAILLAPPWNKVILSSAPFLAFPGNESAPQGVATPAFALGSVVDFREGASTVVTVTKTGDDSYMLYQDGVSESATIGFLHRTIGHLPLLLHGQAKRVLVIGLGAGHTLAAVTVHPLESIDCVEISPEVRDVARQYFAGSAVDDPRVRLRIGDGRNHLRQSMRQYDVIISQPSHPWLSGASALFTREFFTDVRDRLAPGGVAASWFSTYTEDSRQSIIRAFVEAFPTTFLFHNHVLPTLLIGLKDGERFSAASVEQALKDPRVRADVARLGFDDPARVLGSLIAGTRRLREYSAGVPVNTDDNGYVAFHGLGNAVQAPIESLSELQEDPLPYIDTTLGSPQQAQRFIDGVRLSVERRRPK